MKSFQVFTSFRLFLLAPALNLFRFDLIETQLWVLGMRWSLGIDALMHGQITPTQAGISLALRGLLPIVVVVAVFLTVAWRYGRLYCGWLCPHFSAVELLNRVLHRAVGKFSLWDKHRVPRRNAQGQLAQPQAAFGGADLYASLTEKATALCFSLVLNHPFLDGNKRVGHAAMETFLLLNGFGISAPVDEQEALILALASGSLSREKLLAWVEAHVHKVCPPD